MEFKSSKGIFLQIADNLCNKILEENMKPGERIVSVRELAAELEVNRNTVMRTYTFLQEEGIIQNKRGIGFFVADDAVKLINKKAKNEFFENELPAFIKKVKLLKLNSKDLNQLLSEINNNNYEDK
ncbi:MAG: GntR family transcriptional regulator [Bacteroidota bacterium]